MANKVLIFLIFLFLAGVVSAADFEINFLRDNYAAKDSVQVLVLNNLTLVNDIGFGNVKLYRDERIPLSLNLYKIDDGYFIFFDLPGLEKGDYSFIIGDLSYVEGGVLKKGNFTKNLTVESLNYSLSVFPMFLSLDLDYWERPRLSLRLRNNLDDVNVSINGNDFIKPRVSEIKLKRNEEYLLLVDIDQNAIEGFDAKGDLVIDYGYVYKIPIYVHKRLKGRLVENITIVKEDVVVIKEGLRFVAQVDAVNRSINESTMLEGALSFKNFADVTLHNLRFNLTNDLGNVVRMEYNGLDFIDPGEERYVVLFVNEDTNIDRDYNGRLVITTKEGVSAEFPIYLHFKESVKEVKIEEEPVINYSDILPERKEEESNLVLYIVIVVFIGLLIVAASYFYRKGKGEKKRFEDLFRV